METDITIRYDVDSSGSHHLPDTGVSDSERTLRADRTMLPDVHPGPSVTSREFVLRGLKYYYTKSLSDNSGEAQVFLVHREGKDYVLKIYYPNVDIKRETLKVISNISFDMIVRVYDFGKLFLDGSNRYYELMEYLRGGTLAELELGEDINLFRRIALQAAAALSCCHTNNVIHKDIKPSNFFFRDEARSEIVLGDFGISSIMTGDGHLHRTTQARTPLYAAPEMYNDVIDGEVEITSAADYYSLGITLLTLWVGMKKFNTNERMIMKRKNEGRLPGISSLPERVKMIVQGLTAVNPESRWSYKEVEKWFLGESPEVDIASPYLKYGSFVVDPERNLVADNIKELVPMLADNERIACGYLYSGKLCEWLERCGNTKLSIVLNDIVRNRYPADQTAGLMAAIYAMDSSYPYKDIHGNMCSGIHEVASALFASPDEYSMLLKNPRDRFWVYLEAHSNADIKKLHDYFKVKHPDENRKALSRLVYEIDADMPFFAGLKSSTLPDIVRCFGYETMSEDDWQSVTDGRLQSWMYSHSGGMACESMRIMTEGQPYSRELAYKVLYNIDKTAAYDLREADTPEKVGEVLREHLIQWQHLDEAEFTERMKEYSEHGSRFFHYAQLHGWFELVSEATRCFDIGSDENRNRFCAYDLRTAAYRMCRILGVMPEYELSDGSRLVNGKEIDNRYRSEIRREMHSGFFIQWLSVFYHEDPYQDFSEAYSYERTLEEWINVLGSFDAQTPYYKRFVTAKEETSRKYKEVGDIYNRLKDKENTWRFVFYGLCSLWLLLLIFCGVGNREYVLEHAILTIGLPVGGASALIVGIRTFFKGYGFVLSFLCGAVGASSSLLPIWALRFTEANMPLLFIPVIILFTAIYIIICHLTDFRRESQEDKKFINEILDDDIKSTLIEPLYYTFKTKSYKFRGSKFGMLDDVQNRIRSIAGESVLHYILWSLMAAFLVIEMIVYNPHLLNVDNPYSGCRKASQAHVITHIKADV